MNQKHEEKNAGMTKNQKHGGEYTKLRTQNPEKKSKKGINKT